MTPTMLGIDDDDTTPTENAAVLAGIGMAMAAAAPTVVDWGVTTSAGIRRRVNEDAWSRRGPIYVVADGMGGRGGGAFAARTAIDCFLERVATVDEGAHAGLRRAVADANDDVLAAAARHGIERVGTTLLAAHVGGPIVTLVHVGDSRAYRRSTEGRLDVLTHDHTLRAELLAAGLDTADYRDRGVALNGLTSFIGLEPDVLRIDVLAVPVRAGDRLLLCTDGVHRQLDDDELQRIVATGNCPAAADRLVARADELGGRDNATAMVIELGGP